MDTVIITGATGFIGSRIALNFLLSGWKVIALGRGKNDIALKNRITNVINEIGNIKADKKIFENLTAIVINICEPDLGIDHAKINLNTGGGKILFHIAGDTSFHPGDPEKQRLINFNGTLNIFKVFGHLVDIAVHVSTAYVSGSREGFIFENELDKGQSFRNCYEKSKFDTEVALHKYYDNSSVPLVIQRPSIIINDTRTGRSSTFTHLNALVEVINRTQIHHHVYDGVVASKEIRHIILPNTHPNLAPVDPIVEAMVLIGTNKKSIGRTFHLTHPNPQSNAEVIGLLSEAFKARDLIKFPYVKELPDDLSWTEKMILRSLKIYLPFMNNECFFDLTNTRSIVKNYDSLFKPIDLEYLHKVIRFQRSKSHVYN